jgi:isoprenylcysteine carboxyl methyltransferase (ICMT) family protein YpbQ
MAAAIVFSIANALVLNVRIRAEDAAFGLRLTVTLLMRTTLAVDRCRRLHRRCKRLDER